jgi:hypothetical protein
MANRKRTNLPSTQPVESLPKKELLRRAVYQPDVWAAVWLERGGSPSAIGIRDMPGMHIVWCSCLRSYI